MLGSLSQLLITQQGRDKLPSIPPRAPDPTLVQDALKAPTGKQEENYIKTTFEKTEQNSQREKLSCGVQIKEQIF